LCTTVGDEFLLPFLQNHPAWSMYMSSTSSKRNPSNCNNTTVTTTRRIQKVVLIRHGVAQHNILVHGQRPNLHDPQLLDPPLTYEGKQQALEVGERLSIWYRTTTLQQLGKEYPQLVLVSPLTRCLQTAMLAFLPGHPSQYSSNNKQPQWLATDLCREAYGIHYPDRRRNVSVLKQHWPIVEWGHNNDEKNNSFMMTETDMAWQPDTRETVPEVLHRIAQFWDFVVQRPEEHIVVVTHGVWMETCLHQYCPVALDHGQRRVYNGNMFALDCVSQSQGNDVKFLRLENARQI
jgi:broad specificity phosphatase PhoE